MKQNNKNIIFDFYQNTQESNFVFMYRGIFLEHLTSRLVEIGESINTMGVVKRKMSFLLVECFQNILRYSENTSANSDGYFSFRVVDGAFVINSINLVKTEDVSQLIQRVTEINLLDKKELKEIYLNRLETGKFNDKGGAGLGLIEIARKSGRKLKYKIEEVNADFYNFHQQVTLRNKGDVEFKDVDLIEVSKQSYQGMEKSNVLMEYKGDFSRNAIMPLLNIVENSVVGKLKLKKVGHVMIEMLQNISKHNSSQDYKIGVCSISQVNDKFIINTGNIIDSNSVEKLKNKIEYLNGMTHEELSKYHARRILEVYDESHDVSSELGLIEIAKFSNGELVTDFIPNFENGKSFFSFVATV